MICSIATIIEIWVGMWLPYQLSHLVSSYGARNDASKIENNKTQQTTIKFKQSSLQNARHPIHRVRIRYCKFSYPKTCRNVHENSLKKAGHTRFQNDSSPSQTRQWRQRAFDTHACVVVSKLYDVTNMQKKKTRSHFSRVSFGEIFWKFACFMI